MAEHMVRKQIYLPSRQNLKLKRLAVERGVSEAEIIRQALERETEMRSTFVRNSTDAWAGIMQFVQERKRTLAGKGKPVQWNRQELYEEREDHWFESKGGK